MEEEEAQAAAAAAAFDSCSPPPSSPAAVEPACRISPTMRLSEPRWQPEGVGRPKEAGPLKAPEIDNIVTLSLRFGSVIN